MLSDSHVHDRTSSKQENPHRNAVYFVRQWVVLLMAMLFSTGLWLYFLQSSLVIQRPSQLHKPSNPQSQPQQKPKEAHAAEALAAQLHAENEAEAARAAAAEEVRALQAELDREKAEQPLAAIKDEILPKPLEELTKNVSSPPGQAGENPLPASLKVKIESPQDLPLHRLHKIKGEAKADSAMQQMRRFLQPRTGDVRKDDRIIEAVTKEAKFIGPWKMTFASAAPRLARDFCMKYLGAEHYYFTFPGMPSCAELEWVEFQGKPLEGLVPRPWVKRPFRYFQFHFVKHHRRPTGPMTIVELERALAKMHGNFTTYNQFMDTRVTMEADDLDPIAAKLVQDKQPFLARENVDGTFSLFVEVPHAILVEVVAPKLTVLKPHAWSRCDGPMRPAEVDWSLVASQLHVKVEAVRPRGFVYASTKPQAAANLHASYFLGQHSENSSLLLEKGNGTCFEARAVKWSQPEDINKFEYQWIHWPQTQSGALRLQDVEQYQLQLRSNFSLSHANNWDHYMDFHAGLFIDDCDPVIERLRADGVPHFLTPHFQKFLAVFIQDAGGLVYEVVCHKFSIVKLRNLQQWDFCKRLPPLAIDWSPLSNITS